MVLLLHQVETLKSFVLGSIKATDQGPFGKNEQRIPAGTKKLFQKVWALLVHDGIITEEESKDIQRIIDVRNEIGHSIHDLISDVSAPDLVLSDNKVYDYFALEQFEEYRRKIEIGMRSKYILQISFRDVAFEEAEMTYKEELKRLRKKINRQYNERRAQ